MLSQCYQLRQWNWSGADNIAFMKCPVININIKPAGGEINRGIQANWIKWEWNMGYDLTIDGFIASNGLRQQGKDIT